MTYNPAHRYQVITYSFDSGTDEKMEYPTIKAARAAIRTMGKEYDGYAIWDHLHKRYTAFFGMYPQDGQGG